MRVMLGALTFSKAASSLGVRGASSRRASTENWCGATGAVLSKRTRREIRMQAIRRSLVRRSRSVRVMARAWPAAAVSARAAPGVVEGRTGVVVGAMSSPRVADD